MKSSNAHSSLGSNLAGARTERIADSERRCEGHIEIVQPKRLRHQRRVSGSPSIAVFGMDHGLNRKDLWEEDDVSTIRRPDVDDRCEPRVPVTRDVDTEPSRYRDDPDALPTDCC